MRLDVFLKKACLVKSRTIAKHLCENGDISVNGKKARASHVIKKGDKILVREKEIEVLSIPEGNIKKKDAVHYYRVIEDS